jgi:hypothetical protein
LIAILCWSCKTDNKYPYAIKDFRKPLQPQLTRIVSKGIVGYYYRVLSIIATDNELIQLGQSEHPVLRATAFREMLYRKTFDHFDIVMGHLDDTAVVATDAGEFGLWYRTVSDDIIEEATWKNSEDENKTIDKVITKHNYLRAAFKFVANIEPQEKYYPYIKDMAEREGKMAGIYNPYTEDVESALYGLAKFKKKADVEIIKARLLSIGWRLGLSSFALMREFPDTAYLAVFEKYYPGNFYSSICRESSIDNAGYFINAIAVYKNERSAKILGSILNRKPFINCPGDTNSLKHTLIYAIWDNPCEAYAKLRKQIETSIKKYEKNRMAMELPLDGPVELKTDTSAVEIR